MIGLLDANNFYVSCQRSFDPALQNRPVIILSNNDGCVVARSNEVKPYVKMGQPFFQIEELRKQHDIAVFSSNYTLYGDMSARIMATLARFVESVEVYSIDEAFLDLNGYESIYPDLTQFAHTLRQTVDQWLRIPVSVGLAPTKSLAKVANWYAKREPQHNGVLMLDTDSRIQAALEDFEVGNLWGVGWRYAGLLKRKGICTAWKFRNAPDDWIRENMTVNGLRLAYELRGTPCKLIEWEPVRKKAICTAPSFGRLVADLDIMRQALITHVGRAAEKLRRQHSAAGVLTVFLHTNRYKRSLNGELAKQYYNSRTIQLPHPTASTSELTRYAVASLESIFQFGYEYQKTGLILSALVPDDHQQVALFHSGPDARLKTLSTVIDKLNKRHGRDRVRIAAAGYDPTWHHKQGRLSPCYTTKWKDILVVK